MLRSIEQSRNRRMEQLRGQVRLWFLYLMRHICMKSIISTLNFSRCLKTSLTSQDAVTIVTNTYNWLINGIAQVEEYQGMLENSGLVGYAQEVLKETDQSCFVQTAKQLHVRYANWWDLHLYFICREIHVPQQAYMERFRNQKTIIFTTVICLKW